MDVNGATGNTFNTTPGGIFASCTNVSLSYVPPNGSSAIAGGDPLYLWVFNNASPSAATQWGVFDGGSNWEFPTSFPYVASLTTTTGTAILGSEITSGSNTGDFELATVGAVPEPSSLAAVGSIIVFGSAFALRRRRSRA